MLFRRNIVERIKTITPFFTLDKDPYIVVTPKGLLLDPGCLHHVQTCYPGSQPHDQGFNYIRNSVKIIVDAYNGTVDYYVAEPADPIIQAYRRIYPGLLKIWRPCRRISSPMCAIPKDLFDIQLDIYRRYHQTVEEFYKQEDLWAFPVIERGAKPEKITPITSPSTLLITTAMTFCCSVPWCPRPEPTSGPYASWAATPRTMGR